MKLKYTQLEMEKRWLVKPDCLPDLSQLPKIIIRDGYYPNTRMRLRSMFDERSGKYAYKLCKKYDQQQDAGELITNIYLSKNEYEMLNQLPSYPLHKNRYHYAHSGFNYSIQEFLHPKHPFMLLELELSTKSEFPSILPSMAGAEVTQDPAYQGYFLSDRDSLKQVGS